jgi:hypothetical protein
MSKKMHIRITDDGMMMETSGFGGKGCLKAAKDLDDAMRADGVDARMVDMKPTQEMGEIALQKARQQVSQ